MADGTPKTRLWHPFAAMGKVDGHELVLVRGEGSTVWDVDGTEYLDATAGLWFANVGHAATGIGAPAPAGALMRFNVSSCAMISARGAVPAPTCATPRPEIGAPEAPIFSFPPTWSACECVLMM